MAIKTRVTEMLGIEHPIVQGGMQNVGYAELASAVSNAGGLGTITALTQPSPAALRDEIERCRSMTDKPFAVNVTVLPAVTPPDYKAFAQVVIDSGIKICETAGTAEVRELWAMMKPHGITILHKCTAVRHAHSKPSIEMMSQPLRSAESAWRTAVHLWRMVMPCGFIIAHSSRTSAVPAVSQILTPLSITTWAKAL